MKTTKTLQDILDKIDKMSASTILEVKNSSPKDDKRTINKKMTLDKLKSTSRKYKVPPGGKGDKFSEFVKTVIKNMNLMKRGVSRSGLQLTGQPGLGKTSSMVQLSILLGMDLFVLEGSAITEDQFVEIPYVVFRKGIKKDGVIQAASDNGEYDLVNAESALATQIGAMKLLPEAQWMQQLNQHKNLKVVFNDLEKIIRMIRMKSNTDKSGFKAILLLDEYFRTGSKKISNLLRTILNGKIGNTEIPQGVYIITASNVDNSDGSLDTINLNQDFSEVSFDKRFKPSKDDFFRFMADKYTPADLETGVEDRKTDIIIQPEVYNVFEKDVANDDTTTVSNGVRLSPRRLEQIMLFINNRMPVKDKTEAGAVLKYIKSQFTDPETGEISKLLPKYLKITKDIIKETSGITDVQALPDTDWNETLSNQLDAKMEIGKAKSYPIVLAGMPGVGKTAVLKDISENKQMGLIDIDASTLTIDDTVGVTLPDESGSKIKTTFSKPPLYVKIMKQYKEQIASLKKSNISIDRKYNVILFIDELNRTTKDIFNKIRILLLEQKVGSAKYTLPDDIIILSAMNPGSEGTTEMPEHFKDVLDVVQVKMGITQYEDYIKSLSIFDITKKELGFNVDKLSFTIMQTIYNRFKSDVDINGDDVLDINVQPFYWNTGDNVIYVSAREMSFMYQQIIDNIYIELISENIDLQNVDNDKEITRYINIAKNETYDAISNKLAAVFRKQEVEEPDANKFLKVIADIIKTSPIFKEVIFKKENKSLNNMSFSSIIAGNNYDINKVIKEGLPYVNQWLKSINDFADADNDMVSVYNYANKEYKISKLLQFMINIVKLFSSINWKDIPGGNGIKDKLKNSFKARLNAILDRSDYEDAMIEDDDVFTLTNELVDTIDNF